jgi:RecB family endonuclease NucS
MTNLYHAKDGNLVLVSRKRLANEDQLQAWIAADPRLIGLDVLVLGREVSTEFGGRIDILALDREGNIVVVECKRDRTPRDIIAQSERFTRSHITNRASHFRRLFRIASG